MIALAGTFVLDTVTEAVSWWATKLRPGTMVTQAPYGQVLESLHDPSSLLRTNTGINVVLIRPEDFLRTGDRRQIGDRRTADRFLDELADGFTRVLRGTTAVWLGGVLPPSPSLRAWPEAVAWVESSTARITELISDTPWLHQLDLDSAVELYEVPAVHDEYSDAIAHLPYSDEYLVAVGTVVARTAESVWATPRKVIVLDCDNTLWHGVCGEDGPQGVILTEQHLWLQRFMMLQRANGRLLCLCSRNNKADVLAVFAARSEMALKIEDVTTYRIGWGSKTTAIAELSEELGLALNSFVFVDDDSVECEMVRAQWPEVAVVQVPHEPGIIITSIQH
jgi:HAD superfamily phosphatase (TIGR01681 family)